MTVAPHSYTVHFDETGGYDCMYGAFIIKDRHGAVLLEVDLRHYGQQPCAWGDLTARETAGKVAQRVLDALNVPPVGPSGRQWTDSDFLDQALTNATGSILSQYAADVIRKRAIELRLAAAAAPSYCMNPLCPRQS